MSVQVHLKKGAASGLCSCSDLRHLNVESLQGRWGDRGPEVSWRLLFKLWVTCDHRLPNVY